MKIGTLLLRLRKERRLSQDEVAGRLGICQSAYCGWESDRATPSAKHYGSLAALFGIDIRDLMEGSPTPQSLANIALPSPVNNPALLLTEELVKVQREAIALQKQRMECLEAENQQLRLQLTALEKLLGGMAAGITSLLAFISFPLEFISELIVVY